MAEVLAVAQAVVLSIIAGILWAALGYWKARQKGEEFSGPKFIRALIIGGIVGLISGWQGWSFEISQVVLTQLIGAFGATGLIDLIAAEIWKRVSGSAPKELPKPKPGG